MDQLTQTSNIDNQESLWLNLNVKQDKLDLLDTHIEELGIPAEVRELLNSEGIYTITDLLVVLDAGEIVIQDYGIEPLISHFLKMRLVNVGILNEYPDYKITH